MNVVVNGEPQSIAQDATLADVVAAMGRDPQTPGTAMARNGAVVPRREWSTTTLCDGDTIEVLTAVGGG